MNKTLNISGKTTVCGIIGEPIEHTMSPAMHNAAYKALGLDYVYLAFKVKDTELPGAIEGMRGLNIRGLNVTIPHKVAVIRLLDQLDPMAQKIGAVNTIVNEKGRLSGYNTDTDGFSLTLKDNGVNPTGKKVLVIGAGGAARAICFKLAETGADITILNRNQAMAEALSTDVNEMYPGRSRAARPDRRNLEDSIKRAHLLVNATSVGMIPNADETVVGGDLLNPNLIVLDAVYNPLETRLIREAKAVGAKTIGGQDMLVWQGAIAFEKFTGQKPPVDIMKKAALQILTT